MIIGEHQALEGKKLMPRPAMYALSWSSEQNSYVLSTQGNRDTLLLYGDDAPWFTWLAAHTSFSFQGRYGHLSLLKETRPSGGKGYWYAYRRQGKRIVKQYAGRTSAITIARLEGLAQEFGVRSNEAPLLREDSPPMRKKAIQASYATPEALTSATCQRPALDPIPLAPFISQVPLLASKLRPPRLDAPLLLRERLLTMLDIGLARKLTLLLAPAGFGKTTLLAQWAAHSQRQVAWITLGNEENDPSRFLAYLVGALQQVYPAIEQRALVSSYAGQQESLPTAIAVLLNELAALPEEVIVIFDNFQAIKNPVIQNTLTLMLDHLPPYIHLVVAGRSEPLCPLARLHASQQLTELRADALRFTHEEMETFLISIMKLDLSPTELATLEQRTEGWIAGVHLARCPRPGSQNFPYITSTLAGNNRYILAYFLEEVFEQQPKHVQSFLLHTALLDCFTSSLCCAMLGQANVRSIFEHLERANLFFFPCEEQEGWYRYHSLFADALRSHLEHERPELPLVLHTRASRWFEAHGLVEEAIKHALAAQDSERAATLIEQVAPAFFARGEVATLQHWLAALPDNVIHASPRLCITAAWMMFITPKVEIFLFLIDAAERALHLHRKTLPLAAVESFQAEIVALRAISALSSNDFSCAIALCHQALQSLPAGSLYLRGLALLILGLASAQEVNVGAGVQILTEACSCIQAIGHALLFIYVIVVQAELHMAQGHLSQAKKLYQQTLLLAPGQDVLSAFAAGNAHAGLGCLFWEWNNLEEARQHLLLAWELGTQTQAGNILVLSALFLALVSQAQGKREEIDFWLQRAEAMCRRTRNVESLAVVVACRARLALAEGRLEEALLWMHKCHPDLEDPRSRRDEYEKLTLVRVLIAAGRSTADASYARRALVLVEHVRVGAEVAGRVRIVLESLILQALALQLQGEGSGALCILERAVALAEQGRYIRLFVDEGDALTHLLRRLLVQYRVQKARGQTLGLTYLSNLLKASTHPDVFFLPASPAEGQPPLDLLSRREYEVLRLLAAGYKNREIADALVVVTGTVKAHINTIYQKLEVNSRVQAVARARALGLL